MTITPEYLDELERIRNEKGDGPWSIPVDWAEFVSAALPALPALIAEVRRLREVTSKLPTTADGVPVVPGMTVYDIEGNPAHVRGFIYGEWFDASVRWGETGENDEIRCEYYYSTRQASEAAREGK